MYDFSLRIQVCPKQGIISTILFWKKGFRPSILLDREGSGFLGFDLFNGLFFPKARNLRCLFILQLMTWEATISTYKMGPTEQPGGGGGGGGVIRVNPSLHKAVSGEY